MTLHTPWCYSDLPVSEATRGATGLLDNEGAFDPALKEVTRIARQNGGPAWFRAMLTEIGLRPVSEYS